MGFAGLQRQDRRDESDGDRQGEAQTTGVTGCDAHAAKTESTDLRLLAEHDAHRRHAQGRHDAAAHTAGIGLDTDDAGNVAAQSLPGRT
jgi:hypothetical protein